MLQRLSRGRVLLVLAFLSGALVAFSLSPILWPGIIRSTSVAAEQPANPATIRGLMRQQTATPSGLVVTVQELRTEPSIHAGYLNAIITVDIENQSPISVLKTFFLMDDRSNEYKSWHTIPVEGLIGIPFLIEQGQSVSGSDVFIVPEAAMDTNLHFIWPLEVHNERIDVQLSEPPFEPPQNPFQEAAVPQYQEES